MISVSSEREQPEHARRTGQKLWSSIQNPRIVRVSRAFTGKDRHSKVSTVRGLRDRRVRLSVPTAIQLYDLQEKLGVNQPSKVIEWLIGENRHEIDKLPPLQFPPIWGSGSAIGEDEKNQSFSNSYLYSENGWDHQTPVMSPASIAVMPPEFSSYFASMNGTENLPWISSLYDKGVNFKAEVCKECGEDDGSDDLL